MPSQEIFWLKTLPLPSSPSPNHTSLYLRHASSGSPSIVCTPTPPKFLRAHLEAAEPVPPGQTSNKVEQESHQDPQDSPGGSQEKSEEGGGGSKIIFTTYRPQDHTRQWGFVLEGVEEYGSASKRGNRDMWAPVHVVEGAVGDNGFTFSCSASASASAGDAVEGTTPTRRDAGGKEGNEVLVHPEVRGWMICPWALGHAQLFWLTDAFEQGKLPEFCERVEIVRGPVVGQVQE